MVWLNLENALYHYGEMLKYFWPAFRGLDLGLEPERLFPLAGFQGMYLYLTYPGQQACPEAPLPIFGIGDDGELDPYFAAFEALFDTVDAGFAVGRHDSFGCTVDPDQEIAIWRQYNSAVLRW